MPAITIDLDPEMLATADRNVDRQSAYDDVRKHLAGAGFNWQQGSVYFGDDTVDAVRCVLAVQELSRRCVWFSPSVRDIRMLRIEDNNDLMPAVASVRPS